METMQLTTVQPIRTNLSIPVEDQSLIAYTPFVDVTPQANEYSKYHTKHFIEANTKQVDIAHLKNECIVPVFSKDNEMTISHANFIDTVHSAAYKFFSNETVLEPDIRVSHVIKGRVPEAIHKSVNQLLESDKTIYYERMAFCFEIPSIYEAIDGNRLNLTVGGVRAYNQENLYSRKSAEKFKLFVGFKNLVCCNMCVSTDGYKDGVKVVSSNDLFNAAINLFQLYNPAKHLHQMHSFRNSYMTEHQFAQFIGKTKLYHCLAPKEKKLLPEIAFTDNHINAIARAYYQDDCFKRDDSSREISMWKVYNLLTSANKSSYVDSFLDRSLNATVLAEGINKALHGDKEYRWFIE